MWALLPQVTSFLRKTTYNPIKNVRGPVEISAANGEEVYAYGSGTFRVATSANDLGREGDIQDGIMYLKYMHDLCR